MYVKEFISWCFRK